MTRQILTPLQLREFFHLEFMRWFSREIEAKFYAIKGGSNMRFFFKSVRYSEDMDLDVVKIEIYMLRDIVMNILENPDFQDGLRPFGIERVMTPDTRRAKQTETTQRFKIHLAANSGEDLFTKIEFSRRGFKGNIVVQPVSGDISRTYKMPPLLLPHYDITSAVLQKIGALASRAVIQARDIFDLFILSSQCGDIDAKNRNITIEILDKAYEGVLEISFDRFRDTVISYLPLEDQTIYNSTPIWDEVKLKVADFIGILRRQYEQ